MRISIVHSHRLTRQVMCKALSAKLDAEVVDFSSIEELLDSSMNYDVFIVYNMFGREKLDRWEGVKWIRAQKPDALVISMIHQRFFDRKDAPPSSDAVLFCAGDDIDGLVALIKKNYKGKSFLLPS
jgi:DNA-binding NarL/FixJ family response regulator